MFDSTEHLVSYVKAMEKSAPKHYKITIDFCDLSDLVNKYIKACNQLETVTQYDKWKQRYMEHVRDEVTKDVREE